MDECGISGVLHSQETLFGIVKSGGTIQGKLKAEGILVGEVGFPKCDYPEVYNGDYEVTPKRYAQSLNTDDKYMREDVQIKAIPYFEVSNESGVTCYIADEL